MALVPCQVLRVAILLSYCSILCNYKAIEMPSHQTYGGSWKFLTFIDLTCFGKEYFLFTDFSVSAPNDFSHWLLTSAEVALLIKTKPPHCQVIQAVFFGICVLTDLSSLLTRGSGSQEQERQLKKLISLRDWMLAVLAFPVGIFVVAVFWIIYAYDREMIYPKLLDNFIPGWLNHGMVFPFQTFAERREDAQRIQRLGDWLLEIYSVNLIMSLPGLKSFKGSLMSTAVSQRMVWIFLMMCEIILRTYW
ncbi:androgen-induced gene 1 protein isoform X3 [Delphinapterus leucas]|uniref:Androgen-induced gene 1 protein isoform X3 n=1 Tax=Delphinapterus leucas TaxID=9749 RepID=A0A2Y9LYE0_DELLE|nr:androgen-induced gene 1 protein isoform X3 [Delphinapterus leucas]